MQSNVHSPMPLVICFCKPTCEYRTTSDGSKKIHVKTWIFKYEMKSQLLKSNFFCKLILKQKHYCSKKVSVYLIFTHLIWCEIIYLFIYYFDIIKSYFLNPHVNFVWMIKTISLFQKFIMCSIFYFEKLIHIFQYYSH